jgi:hypothetical protein
MLAILRALFGRLVDIILLRRGPEQLPASRTLLALVIALNVVGSLLMAGVVAVPVPDALLQSLVASGVMLLWYHWALILAQKRERFLQTMTALFGVSALFLPVLMPLVGAMLPYLQKPDPNAPPPATLLIMTTVVSIWGLVVDVRVVRAAFESSWVGAVLLVFGEFFAAIFVSTLLLGDPSQAS